MSLAKRRRRKTVHFGDNFLLQVCANTNFCLQPAYGKMEENVQKFFNFIESVLSTWVRTALNNRPSDRPDLYDRDFKPSRLLRRGSHRKGMSVKWTKEKRKRDATRKRSKRKQFIVWPEKWPSWISRLWWVTWDTDTCIGTKSRTMKDVMLCFFSRYTSHPLNCLFVSFVCFCLLFSIQNHHNHHLIIFTPTFKIKWFIVERSTYYLEWSWKGGLQFI